MILLFAEVGSFVGQSCGRREVVREIRAATGHCGIIGGLWIRRRPPITLPPV